MWCMMGSEGWTSKLPVSLSAGFVLALAFQRISNHTVEGIRGNKRWHPSSLVWPLLNKNKMSRSPSSSPVDLAALSN